MNCCFCREMKAEEEEEKADAVGVGVGEGAGVVFNPVDVEPADLDKCIVATEEKPVTRSVSHVLNLAVRNLRIQEANHEVAETNPPLIGWSTDGVGVADTPPEICGQIGGMGWGEVVLSGYGCGLEMDDDVYFIGNMRFCGDCHDKYENEDWAKEADEDFD